MQTVPKKAALVLATMVTLNSVTSAEEIHGTPSFELGTDFSQHTYQLFTPKHKKYREDSSPMAGIYAHLHLPYERHQIDIQGHMHISRGMTDRQTSHSRSTATSDIHRTQFNVKAEYGYTLPILDLTPAVGIGYMGYDDHAAKTNPDLNSLSSHVIYASMGVSMKIKAGEHAYIQPKIAYDTVLAGQQKVTSAAHHQRTYLQNKGYGLEFSTRFAHQAGSLHEFSVTPYVNMMHLTQNSDHKTAHTTITKEMGIQMGYAF